MRLELVGGQWGPAGEHRGERWACQLSLGQVVGRHVRGVGAYPVEDGACRAAEHVGAA